MTQRVTIGFNAYTVEWLLGTRAGQTILKENHHRGIRPRCLCQDGGIEMYIGRRGPSYYLSRMPGSGFLHAPDCGSAEKSGLYSGAVAYASGAIIESADGHLCLTVDLDSRPRIDSPLTHVGLDGLLDLLIEQANLNRIAPSDETSTWSSVRTRLLEAATSISIGKIPLTDIIHLPEPFSLERAHAAQSAFEESSKASPGILLVLAPLKHIELNTYSWKIVLKHLPAPRLWLSKDTATEIEGRWGRPLISKMPEHALALLSVKSGRHEGNFNVSNMALSATNRHFFPCRTEREEAAVKAELASGYSLLRPLRFDARQADILCDFARLEELNLKPIFVISPGDSDEKNAAKRLLITLMKRNGVPGILYSD